MAFAVVLYDYDDIHRNSIMEINAKNQLKCVVNYKELCYNSQKDYGNEISYKRIVYEQGQASIVWRF